MKITNMGSDFISIDENNLNDSSLTKIPKVHLIKLNFFKPTKQKVENVIENFPSTNRFVIVDNIRIYNYILKETNKKYYIENGPTSNIISFFRKNNKVLINFNNLNVITKSFLLCDDVFEDVLKNSEVIMVDKHIFNEKKNILKNWPGNVIISEGGIKGQ
jgi:hypothetical protein